mmetsp:Transcript_61052/g.196700  ORF Transcript_61052/g.196700 Transcript_61052/m.196700 type:complete len:373 (-) Transcript_61052:341-1459(-)
MPPLHQPSRGIWCQRPGFTARGRSADGSSWAHATTRGHSARAWRRRLTSASGCNGRRRGTHRLHRGERRHVRMALAAADVVADALLARRLYRCDVRAGDVVLGAAARHPALDDVGGVLLQVNLDVSEASKGQHLPDLILSGGARNSASVALDGLQPLGDLTGAEHIRDGDTAAGHQDPVHLAVDLLLLGGEVDDAVGDHAIRNPVAHWQVLDLAEAEGDVRDPIFDGSSPCLGQHLWRHIHTQDMPTRADLTGSDEAIHACAAAQVHDHLPRLQLGRNEWVPAAQPQVCRLGYLALFVAHQLPPLVEVADFRRQHASAAHSRHGVGGADGVADAPTTVLPSWRAGRPKQGIDLTLDGIGIAITPVALEGVLL